mmetsp:Transcript_34430/g.83280  ORF Transcript_34430/g.83280 Transcript_34430/m.83280 type:complete len:521 (+) Transcript_34430:136-1698(+)
MDPSHADEEEEERRLRVRSLTESSARSVQDMRRKVSLPKLLLLIGALVLVGACNFAMFKSMYSAFGEHNAYFVSQGVNLLYMLYGGILVYPRLIFCHNYKPIRPRRWTSDSVIIKSSTTLNPRWKFLIMGTLDCFGTFFTAMGAVYTPGVFQTLLNQTLIPCTMLFSFIFLRAKYNTMQIIGATVIIFGAIVSIGPAIMLTEARASRQFRWYACLIYFFSNVPMAMSSVYKEMAFRHQKIDVLYLTQWVSVFQFFIGFLLAPMQNLPGFGRPDADKIDVYGQMNEGISCWLERVPKCRNRSTFILLPGYVAINFIFNTLGLYITKRSSAVMTSIAYALLLPMTAITFSLQIMGPYRERITNYTWIGLFLALSGFLIYRCFSPLPRQRKRQESTEKIDKVDSGSTLSENQENIEPRFTEKMGTPTPLCGAQYSIEGKYDTEFGTENGFQERTGAIDVVMMHTHDWEDEVRPGSHPHAHSHGHGQPLHTHGYAQDNNSLSSHSSKGGERISTKKYGSFDEKN